MWEAQLGSLCPGTRGSSDLLSCPQVHAASAESLRGPAFPPPPPPQQKEGQEPLPTHSTLGQWSSRTEGRWGLLLSGWGQQGGPPAGAAHWPKAGSGWDPNLPLPSPSRLLLQKGKEEESAGLRSPHPRLASVTVCAICGRFLCEHTQAHAANVHTWATVHKLPSKLLSKHRSFHSQE